MGIDLKASVGEDFPPGSTFYIVNVSGGCCLQAKGNDGVFTHTVKEDENQYWQVERDGDNADKVALKNIGNGEYLYGTGNAAGSRIMTRPSPQYWTPSEGYTKNAYYFKCYDHPNAWLVNRDGSSREGSRTDCWPFQDAWKHALSWYLVASPKYTPKGWAGNAPQSQAAQSDTNSSTAKDDTKSADRESALAEQEGAQKKKTEELTALEKQLNEKASDMSGKEKSLLDREATLARKEKELAGKEQNSKPGRSDGDAKELQQLQTKISKLEGQTSALERVNTELINRGPVQGNEKDMAEVRDLLRQLVALQKKASANTAPVKSPSQGPSTADSAAQPTSGQSRIKSTAVPSDRQIDEATKKQQKALPAHVHRHNKSVGASRTPKIVDSMVDHEGSHLVVFDCGHVLHKPPRKVRKEMVGILYA